MFSVGQPESLKLNRSVKIILIAIVVIVGVYAIYAKSTSKSTIIIPAEDPPSEEEGPEVETINNDNFNGDHNSPPPPQSPPQSPPPPPPPPPPSPPAITEYVDHYDDRNFIIDWIQNYKVGPLIDKWIPYFKTYERHFGRYRNKYVVMVEVGVQSGGSTMLWPEYFGRGLKYYGLDINRNCEQFERKDPEKGIFVQIDYVDQNSIESLTNITKIIPDVPDIILDDGGHTMVQQINTFKAFWPWVKKGGVFCCEDTHTSYMDSHGGKYKDPKTFVEWAKNFWDVLHLSHIRGMPHNLYPGWEAPNDDYYHSTIRYMTIADSIVCFEKGDVEPFARIYGGNYSIPYAR